MGYVYICDVTHHEILDTICSREDLHYDEFSKEVFKVVMMRVNVINN